MEYGSSPFSCPDEFAQFIGGNIWVYHASTMYGRWWWRLNIGLGFISAFRRHTSIPCMFKHIRWNPISDVSCVKVDIKVANICIESDSSQWTYIYFVAWLLFATQGEIANVANIYGFVNMARHRISCQFWLSMWIIIIIISSMHQNVFINSFLLYYHNGYDNNNQRIRMIKMSLFTPQQSFNTNNMNVHTD